MPLGVYIIAFHPKAKWNVCRSGRSSGSGYAEHLPADVLKQINSGMKIQHLNGQYFHHSQPYSYGDSAGLPVFAEFIGKRVTGLPF